jgi:hypothetical protein
MDRVVYFPKRMQTEDRRKRFKVKGLSLFLLFLFLILIYQIGSGLYRYFIYNRRLHEAQSLLKEKQQIMERLEMQLRQAEFNSLVETEISRFHCRPWGIGFLLCKVNGGKGTKKGCSLKHWT